MGNVRTHHRGAPALERKKRKTAKSAHGVVCLLVTRSISVRLGMPCTPSGSLVGQAQERRGSQTEGLGGLEVHDQLELGGLLTGGRPVWHLQGLSVCGGTTLGTSGLLGPWDMRHPATTHSLQLYIIGSRRCVARVATTWPRSLLSSSASLSQDRVCTRSGHRRKAVSTPHGAPPQRAGATPALDSPGQVVHDGRIVWMGCIDQHGDTRAGAPSPQDLWLPRPALRKLNPVMFSGCRLATTPPPDQR
jgi:hypothetical protein